MKTKIISDTVIHESSVVMLHCLACGARGTIPDSFCSDDFEEAMSMAILHGVWPLVYDAIRRRDAAIQCSNETRFYRDMDKDLLQLLHVQMLPAGTTTALVGKSGSGKSCYG